MIDIALVAPGRERSREQRYSLQEPLNIGFLATYLKKKGYQVKLFDELAGQNIEAEIDRWQPRYVGLTGVTPLAPAAYRIARLCKEKNITTIMGGVHATILSEEARQHVDIVVKGEGEYALEKILSQNIKEGILQGDFVKELDGIPEIDRSFFQMDYYLRARDRADKSYLADFIPRGMKVTSILTSRGCPWNCNFCHNSWRGLPFRYNSADRVVDELERLKKDYQIGAFFSLEDNFFCLKERSFEIFNLMKERKLDLIWGANARVDNIDEDLFKLAKEVGCRQVTFGFESGSQKILDIWNKKTTVEQIKKAIKLCQKVGIIPNGSFIIGAPGENMEDIKKTKELIQETKLKSYGVSIATVFPGTKLWQWCEERNRIPKDLKWEDFNYEDVPVNPSDFSVEELKMLRGSLKNIKSIKTYLFMVIKSPAKAIRALIKDPKKILKVLRLSV